MHLHGVKCRIGTHPTLARVEGAVNVADLADTPTPKSKPY